MKDRINEIRNAIVEYCKENLNEQYKDMSLDLLAKIEQKDGELLTSSRCDIWVAAILNMVLEDAEMFKRSHPMYITKKAFSEKTGVSSKTIKSKSDALRALFEGEETVVAEAAVTAENTVEVVQAEEVKVEATKELTEDETKYLGSATECALLLRNKDTDYRKMRKEAVVVAQNQFSSNLKRMSTIISEENKYVLLTKGAPEIVLELCKYVQEPDGIKELTKERKEKILSEIAKLQEKSMRALGFAYKEMPLYNESQEAALALEEDEISIEKCEESLVFGGFVGIRDPLRPDVKEAVETANHAGVAVKMLTGDNINTARAIGEDLGLLKNNMRAVEASYIDTLTDEELKEEIKTISIVARSKPDSKMRIVQALQADGEVVAVTGDGINDAPVLAGADVGAAMGSGADAAIEAADVVFMNSEMQAIPQAIALAKETTRIAWQNVFFALAIKIIIMAAGLAGYASMWAAVFADTGVSILCVLNSIRILYKKI